MKDLDDLVFELSKRTVLPRQPHFGQTLPIYVVDLDENVLDESGTVFPLDELIELLPDLHASLLVGVRTGRILSRIQEVHQGSINWDSKTTKKERTRYVPGLDREVIVAQEMIIPVYCGWKGLGKNRAYSPNLFHHFLDPVLFYGNAKTVSDIFPGQGPDFNVLALMEWAKSIRLFAEQNRMTIRPTAGAMASQFLKDRRFYPNARRKVPKATNDRIRRRLPGNHCFLAVDPGGDTFDGFYLDQRRAHHYHARTIRFPDANSLFAYGDFIRLKRVCLEADDFFGGSFSGVVCGEFSPPKPERAHFLPERYERVGLTRRFVWTSEWELLETMGVECRGVIAAWGSFETDPGLGRYARWAEAQLDLEQDAPWLKPILLATYGVLAVNASSPVETLYGGKHDGPKTAWPAGDLLLHGTLKEWTNRGKVEPGYVNVLHRALIEAATRRESLEYACLLSELGYRILMIHVDGLIVEDDEDLLGEIPLIEPWRVKTYLSGLQFVDEQSFTSLQMTRMPGRPLSNRKMVTVDRGRLPKITGELLT